MSGTTHSDLVTITNFIAGGVALKVKKQTATCLAPMKVDKTATCLAPMKVDKDLCYYNTSLCTFPHKYSTHRAAYTPEAGCEKCLAEELEELQRMAEVFRVLERRD